MTLITEELPVAVQPVTWLDILTDETITFDDRLDRWEAFVANLPQQECPLKHTFPEGMYVREIFMPAGSIVTSRIHKFDNPFFITKGRVTVISENEGLVTYVAPYSGITKPGTRRVLFIHEDTTWTTVHLNPSNKTDHEDILNDIASVRENQYLLCQYSHQQLGQ
jgi:hypothetical protein